MINNTSSSPRWRPISEGRHFHGAVRLRPDILSWGITLMFLLRVVDRWAVLLQAGVPQLLPHSMSQLPCYQSHFKAGSCWHCCSPSSCIAQQSQQQDEQRSCKGNPIRGAGAAAVRASGEDGEQGLILQTWVVAEAHQGSGFVLWAHWKLPQ